MVSAVNATHSEARFAARLSAWSTMAALCAACAACAPAAGRDGDGGLIAPSIDGGACVAGRASAQFRAQQAPPVTMLPGARAQVSVTMDNCSGERWSAESFALTARPGSTSPWGTTRVSLPRDVADGERVTIPFEVTAPREAGAYDFTWALTRDGVEAFQEFTPVVTVTVRSSGDCAVPGPVARFVREEAPPAFVGVGERVRGAVSFVNCGADTWTRGAGFALVSALPMGRSEWGVSRFDLPQDVPFGATVTVAVEGTAPMAPGRYPYAWAIAQNGASVGEASPERTIVANARFDCGASGPPARFVSQRHPSELTPGQTADVDVTFANCGEDLWDSAFRIQSVAPAAVGRWGVGAIPLSAPIAPGFRGTTSFRITAPREAGRHAYRWAVSRGDTMIQDPTPAREINVRLGAGPCEVRPVQGVVTAQYGWRTDPFTFERRFHNGIDFDGRNNVTPILACRPGVVIQAGWRGTFGNAIEVAHGDGMSTLYAHQHHFADGITVGAPVRGGQIIGIVGSTGRSTGAHLHFEVRVHGGAVDPNPYL